MFKASSYIPQWFKKSSSSSDSTTSTASATIGSEHMVDTPRSFTLPSLDNENQLVNISMKDNKEDESFVDIEYRQLTYAEVALLAKNKKTQSAAIAASKVGGKAMKKQPQSHKKSNVNQFNSLTNNEDADDKSEANDAYEPYKSDISYQKSKQYKTKQFDSVQKRKLKKSERKPTKSSSSD